MIFKTIVIIYKDIISLQYLVTTAGLHTVLG